MVNELEKFILTELGLQSSGAKSRIIGVDELKVLAGKLALSNVANELATHHPLVKQLQHRVDRLTNDLQVARARFYDLLYKSEKEPTNVELKAEIVYLKDELKKAIEKRDSLKEELASVKLRRK
jgi:predicted  nucleic acid-binding Zn-ribbon protein